MTACFLLDDDGTTRITVRDGRPRPSLTVEGPAGEDKVVTYGILDGRCFVYPHGARFHWDEQRGWWSGNAVSKGETATRVACPED
jgi:hypothetical protein